MTKTFFQIDDCEEKFEGITSGRRWNGWECPLFPIETANKILSTLQDSEESTNLRYSYYKFTPDFSAIQEIHEDGIDMHYPVKFEGVNYFPIGYCNWVWELARWDEEEEEEG
jgi:hypothetical protein